MAIALETIDYPARGTDELLARADAAHVSIARQQAELLELLGEIDERELWRDSGYRDTATFVAARYGITHFAASRRVAAGKALPALPRTRATLERGELSLEKTVELTRMATPESEATLVRWARGVSPSAIRAKADAAQRPDIKEVNSVHDQRSLRWWHEDDGYRFCIAGEMTSDAGAVVAKALDRIADSLPTDFEEGTWDVVDARRVDALVALASGHLGAQADGDRATVVVHADLDDLVSANAHAALEGGALIHPETASRLLCDGRLRTVLHDDGTTVGIGHASRTVPSWLVSRCDRSMAAAVFRGVIPSVSSSTTMPIRGLRGPPISPISLPCAAFITVSFTRAGGR